MKRCSILYLYEIFANFLSVEHCIESGNFIDINGRLSDHFRHLVHGSFEFNRIRQEAGERRESERSKQGGKIVCVCVCVCVCSRERGKENEREKEREKETEREKEREREKKSERKRE